MDNRQKVELMYEKYRELERKFPEELDGWLFSVTGLPSARGSGLARVGGCNFTQKVVVVNARVVPHLDAAECVDTLVHEVAHAIAGKDAGHGPKWIEIAKQLGASTARYEVAHEVAQISGVPSDLLLKWILFAEEPDDISRDACQARHALRLLGVTFALSPVVSEEASWE